MRKLLPTLFICSLLIMGLNACSIVRSTIEPRPAPTVSQEEQLPSRVAILPFVNRTSNPEAAPTVRKMFYNFFSSLNYLDMEPSLIDSTLKTHRVYQKILEDEPVSPQRLGQLLNVEAVIVGEVLSFGKIYALLYTDNQAGLKAKMIHCQSGQPIWELKHTVHLEEGDVPLSPLGLATSALKAFITHTQASHMNAASQLCMEMVDTIPHPAAVTEAPPKILAMVHNGSGRLLRPGDYLKVVLVGDRGKRANWSIPSLVEGLPMQEREPGIYIGAYQIRPADSVPHGRIIGYLSSDTGVKSQWVDILGIVKIGEPTLLPAVIAKDTTLGVDQSPYLVDDALVVLPGAKLSILPGAVVWFRTLGIIVKGELQVLGTEQAPVIMASLQNSNWKGIFLDSSQTNNSIQHCKIYNAEYGFRASKSRVAIRNCLFQDNGWSVVLEQSEVKISGCLIRTSTKTAVAARQAKLQVEDSVIAENQKGGFLLENCHATIQGNNIINNGEWGIKVLDQKGSVVASKNWWGHTHPDRPEIIGPARTDPILEKPIDFKILG